MCKLKYKKTGWYIPGSWVPVRNLVRVERCPPVLCTTVPLTKVIDMMFRTELQRHQNNPYPFLERPAKKGRRPRRTVCMKFKFELELELEPILKPEVEPRPSISPIPSVVEEPFKFEPIRSHQKYRMPDYDVWSEERVIYHLNQMRDKRTRDLSRDVYEDQACARDERVISLIEYHGMGAL